jgi:hypothetical protein
MAPGKPVDFEKVTTAIFSVIQRLLVPPLKAVTQREFQYLFQDVFALTNARPKSLSRELHQALTQFIADHMQSIAKASIPKEQSAITSPYHCALDVGRAR